MREQTPADPSRRAAARRFRGAAMTALAVAALGFALLGAMLSGAARSGAAQSPPFSFNRSLALAFGSDALWKIVHGLCVVDQMRFQSPAPCAEVDLKGGEERGFAILKDIRGATQFLLIPTRRLSGIEDPLIGTDAVPNYWRAAWAVRKLVSANAGQDLQGDDIAMAINGAGSRTQDQLHIHVDCVRVDVRDALRARAGEIGPKWADFTLLNHVYRARRIIGAEPEPDPFRLLAEDKELAPRAEDSLAVIGVRYDGKPGFALIAQRAPNGKSHLEYLLDHNCAVARERVSAEKPPEAPR
jgi:CDP-diacylglycerol pyrophosphatase